MHKFDKGAVSNISITEVKTVAVAGAGIMGALIAQTFASHGYQVVLLRRSTAGLERGRSIMTENPEVKRDFYRGLEPLLKEICLVSANTSGLDIFCGISEYLFADLPTIKNPQTLLRRKKAEEKLSLKSGEGFFDYSGDRGTSAVEARNRKLTALSGILFGK